MKRSMKIWLIAAACLFLIGAILFGGAMTAMNWDFSKLSADNYVTNRYEITENYRNIFLETETANIEFLPSSDGKTTVVCQEWEKMRHSVTVSSNALVIKMEDTRAWYEHISLHTKFPKITVYVPFFYMHGEINVRATTGDITLKEISASNIGLVLTTGDVELRDISCINVSVRTTTGDIELEDVSAHESITLKTTTGDVEFDSCDGVNINIDAITGDVEGNLLTDKIFIVNVKTGEVNVPPSTGRGKCEINVTTGDIDIHIK